jgi:hypothetical protein
VLGEHLLDRLALAEARERDRPGERVVGHRAERDQERAVGVLSAAAGHDDVVLGTNLGQRVGDEVDTVVRGDLGQRHATRRPAGERLQYRARAQHELTIRSQQGDPRRLTGTGTQGEHRFERRDTAPDDEDVLGSGEVGHRPRA